MDNLTPEQRRYAMFQVKSQDTTPEKSVRSILHRLGFRFRLHRRDLPGKPDIVLPKYKSVIFVHGCFWHQHPDCARATMPKSNADYWEKKLSRNSARDQQVQQQLRELGWRVIVVWECELKDKINLAERITFALKSVSNQPAYSYRRAADHHESYGD